MTKAHDDGADARPPIEINVEFFKGDDRGSGAVRDMCHHCPRLTANLGGVCTACLNGHLPIPKGGWKCNGPRPHLRKYDKQTIARVWYHYLDAKKRKVRGPVVHAALRTSLGPAQVQHILSQYPEGRYDAAEQAEVQG